MKYVVVLCVMNYLVCNDCSIMELCFISYEVPNYTIFITSNISDMNITCILDK